MSVPRILGMCLALVVASTGANAQAPKAARPHHPLNVRAAAVHHPQAARPKRRVLARRKPPRLQPRVARRSPPVSYAAASGTAGAEVGRAAWYDLEGRRTASGERFDGTFATAAHRTLPLLSQARVTNLRNGRSVVVTINDRGPFTRGLLIDLSAAAAEKLHMIAAGIAHVLVEPLPAEAAEIPGTLLAASLPPRSPGAREAAVH